MTRSKYATFHAGLHLNRLRVKSRPSFSHGSFLLNSRSSVPSPDLETGDSHGFGDFGGLVFECRA